jgi:hypothetical protein
LATKQRADGRLKFIEATMHECYHAYSEDRSHSPLGPIYSYELHGFDNTYGRAVGWSGNEFKGVGGVVFHWPTNPPDDVTEYKARGLKAGDTGFSFFLDYAARGPHEDWALSATRFTMLWMTGKLEGSEFNDQTALDVLTTYGPFDLELGEARYKFFRKHFGKRCDGGNYAWCAQQDAAGEH